MLLHGHKVVEYHFSCNNQQEEKLVSLTSIIFKFTTLASFSVFGLVQNVGNMQFVIDYLKGL